mmetsp:Transcript_21417/g.67232  ORF Transcript_21417/g.67232 Transcript_21417/m.67232 type:complete len:538 (+) Transcript_21417:22-1635(+)
MWRTVLLACAAVARSGPVGPATRWTQKAEKAAREWRALEAHAHELGPLHELAQDEARCEALSLEGPCGLVLDWSRQRVTEETMRLLFELARASEVEARRDAMRRGERINRSEDRAAMHHTLRAAETSEDVASTREAILAFADGVRRGEVSPPTAARFEAALVVGIGGSQLGPECVARALEDGTMELRFAANVDAFEAATRGLEPRKTLVVASSKSFGTAETSANLDRAERWLLDAYDGDADLAAAHVVVCATRSGFERSSRRARELFQLWDWVGGRFSSTASPGLLPLALAAGPAAARDFLRGAAALDDHFFTAPLERNAPVVLALLGVFNRNVLGSPARAVVPYTDRLARFPAHLQQLEMESSGKALDLDDHKPLRRPAGEIVFGEPGTNAQHSFFQFLHAAETHIPVDFIGFLDSDHALLVANLLAQPDALALGTPADAAVPPYKRFPGDRPSLTILFPAFGPAALGALLALYEHRTAVQGWIWNLNTWDQMAVELGKTLASDILAHLRDGAPLSPATTTPSTRCLLRLYAARSR